MGRRQPALRPTDPSGYHSLGRHYSTRRPAAPGPRPQSPPRPIGTPAFRGRGVLAAEAGCDCRTGGAIRLLHPRPVRGGHVGSPSVFQYRPLPPPPIHARRGPPLHLELGTAPFHNRAARISDRRLSHVDVESRRTPRRGGGPEYASAPGLRSVDRL